MGSFNVVNICCILSRSLVTIGQLWGVTVAKRSYIGYSSFILSTMFSYEESFVAGSTFISFNKSEDPTFFSFNNYDLVSLLPGLDSFSCIIAKPISVLERIYASTSKQSWEIIWNRNVCRGNIHRLFSWMHRLWDNNWNPFLLFLFYKIRCNMSMTRCCWNTSEFEWKLERINTCPLGKN